MASKTTEPNAKADAQTEATTAADSYMLAEDDDNASIASENTFSVTEGISIYGDHRKDSFPKWNASWSGRIVTSRAFKRAVITLVMVNSVSIAVSTFDFVTDRRDLVILFDLFDTFFLVLFSIEIILQFLYLGPTFFLDGWCVFDFLVVTSAWFLHPLLALRTFRIVRTLRLATRVRDLPYLIKALLGVIPKMLSICFLLLILFYTFSIVFTDLFKDLYKDGHTSEDYFSRLDTTALTLFQIMTLDGWGNIVKEVMKVYQWAWLPFLLFIMTSSFFFLNLIIAVICEAVSKVQQERQMAKLGRQMGLRHMDSNDDSSQAGKKTDQELSKLEQKIDKLAASVEMLMKMQVHKEKY